jgi:hypothetical protein
MASLLVILLTLKTTVINNITLANTFYLLRFAYSKTLKSEEKMGGKQSVQNPCTKCGGLNCPESGDGDFLCIKRDVSISKSSDSSEELWVDHTNNNNTRVPEGCDNSYNKNPHKPQKERVQRIFIVSEGSFGNNVYLDNYNSIGNKVDETEKIMKTSILFKVELDNCLYKIYIKNEENLNMNIPLRRTSFIDTKFKEFVPYGTQRIIEFDEIPDDLNADGLLAYQMSLFSPLTDESKFDAGKTYMVLNKKEYTNELRKMSFPSLAKKSAQIIQKACRKFIFRCRLIKRINAKLVIKLKKEVNANKLELKILKKEAANKLELKILKKEAANKLELETLKKKHLCKINDLEKELNDIKIRNGELLFELKKTNTEKEKILKACRDAEAEAQENKPLKKALNSAQAFCRIVMQFLSFVLLFFVYLPAHTIEFIKELPANTKYLTTGVSKGTITFRTTLDGCITCLILAPLNTFCFVMTIVALIYFLR